MTIASTPRRRDAELNRVAILQAAVTVLATDQAASIDTIARAAGLTRRALYGHFEDRDALVAAVIESGAERFNAIASSIADADPRQALAHLADALWAQAEHVHAIAALALNERLVAQTGAALAPLRERLLEICRTGFDADLLRRDIPAELTARLVEEAARGVITHLDPADASSHRLATRAALAAAGLGWQDTQRLLDSLETAATDGSDVASQTGTATASPTPATEELA